MQSFILFIGLLIVLSILFVKYATPVSPSSVEPRVSEKNSKVFLQKFGEGLEVKFFAYLPIPPDGLLFIWDLGNGERVFSEEPFINYHYLQEGYYEVKLHVSGSFHSDLRMQMLIELRNEDQVEIPTELRFAS